MENVLKSSGLVMAHTSNYNRWQFEQFEHLIKGRVLEIGCGIGNMTELLAPAADSIVSVDPKPEAVAYTRRRLGSLANLELKNTDIFTEKLEGGSFDTIFFSNVLEHIEDDLGAMRECHRLLKSKGRLLLLVPSHRWLHGTLDDECGHLRRYTKKQVRGIAKETGFEVNEDYYFNAVGGLGWWTNYCLLRRKGSNNEESSTQVGLFDKLVPALRLVENAVRPPFGISLISIMTRTT